MCMQSFSHTATSMLVPHGIDFILFAHVKLHIQIQNLSFIIQHVQFETMDGNSDKNKIKQFCNIGYKNGANLTSGKCCSVGLYVQYFDQNDGAVAFKQLTDILMGLGWKFKIIFC